MKELQKAVVMGTAHILRRVLMEKYKTFNMGRNNNNNVPLIVTLE